VSEPLAKPLSILYVGPEDVETTSGMRLRAMCELGHDVSVIDTQEQPLPRAIGCFYGRVMNRLGYPLDLSQVNQAVLQRVSADSYDVLWVDALRLISSDTLKKIRNQSPSTFLVSLIMDDPFFRYGRGWRRFKKAVPYYDLHYVVRDQNITDLTSLGARNVRRFHKGFDIHTHCPVVLPAGHPSMEVFFAGHYEPKREKDIVFLLEHDVPVTIIGGRDALANKRYWSLIHSASYIQGGVYGLDYTRAICSAKIALCFYSQWNRDIENSRMYEIPACGTFMLAERNQSNVRMFEEGKEAEFFSSKEELLEKVRYYLANPKERQQIAAAGRQRCLNSGYSYHKRMEGLLSAVREMIEQNQS